MTESKKSTERAKALEALIEAQEQHGSCRARYDRVLSELEQIVECFRREDLEARGEGFVATGQTSGIHSRAVSIEREIPFPSREEVAEAVEDLRAAGEHLRRARKRLRDSGVSPDVLRDALRDA